MSLRELSEAPSFNPFGLDQSADIDGMIAELREQSSVVQTPMGCAVLRREPAHRAFGDPRLTSVIPVLARLQGMGEGALAELLGSTILAMDGADHARLRRLVSASFTPRAADRHRPTMRALVDQLIDGFHASGRCELVTDLADQYPVQVICEVLGVPRDRHADFARWGDSLTYILSLDLFNHLEEVATAALELSEYLDGLIAERQADPHDDLVTSLIQASDAGDRLNQIELRAMLGGLLFAGYDTTRNQLGHGLVQFAAHPDQWARLAERPALAPGAVHEVMRCSSVADGTARMAAEELEIDGWRIPAGTIVMLFIRSANHDPLAFDDPDRFDITREPAVQHLSFGAGPHYCLGANLARAELEEAFVLMSRRMPGVRVDGEVEWRTDTGIKGPSTLPLAFDL
jgi:cytochrome P450